MEINKENNKNPQNSLVLISKRPPKRSKPLEDDNNVISSSKRQRITDYSNLSLNANSNSNSKENVPELEYYEKKEYEEINLQNMWKFSRKIRRQYLCSNYPTILITSINAKNFTSGTSVKKFLGLRNNSKLGNNIISHTFSISFRTIYIHFNKEVVVDDLKKLVENFNQLQLQSKNFSYLKFK